MNIHNYLIKEKQHLGAQFASQESACFARLRNYMFAVVGYFSLPKYLHKANPTHLLLFISALVTTDFCGFNTVWYLVLERWLSS